MSLGIEPWLFVIFGVVVEATFTFSKNLVFPDLFFIRIIF